MACQSASNSRYARASAAVITKRAGVSVGALFRHFETMGDFMAATASEVLRRQVESFTKQVAEIPADRPALEAALTILRDLFRYQLEFRIGIILTGFIVLFAALSFVSPYPPQDAFVVPPDVPPSWAHWFGTTNGQGFDVLSQVIYGARTELIVVVLAVVLSLFIGVPLGLYSGYRGGWVDRTFVLITDALFAFPSLLLAIVVSIAFQSGSSSASGGILAAAISITVVYVPQYFRVVRASALSAVHQPQAQLIRKASVSEPEHRPRPYDALFPDEAAADRER